MQPLSNTKRNILFAGLVLVFILLIPVIVLNSLGYTWTEGFKVSKAGGIYIHSDLPNTRLYINDKFLKENGTFIRNVFVQDLRPNRNYKVVIQKEGYTTWTKDIYVYPSLVSEGHILMLPEEIEQREIYPFFDEEGEGANAPVAGFTIVRTTPGGVVIPENDEYIETVTLFEEKNPFEIEVPDVLTSENISEEEEKILPQYFVDLNIEDPESLENLIETNDEVSWIYKGNIVLYWIDDLEKIPYYYCGGEREKICSDEIFLDWTEDVKRFDYFPGRDNVWVVLVNDGVYAVEIDPRGERNVQLVYGGNDLDFRINDSGNLIVKDKGSYYELDL
jgi:hypothetical protein